MTDTGEDTAPADHGYRALVVDFGGVLTTPLQDAMIRGAEELGIDLQDLVRVALAAYAGEHDPLVTRFETGHLTEEEFSRQFAARLSDVAGREIAPEGLVSKLFGSVRLEDEMFDMIEKVRNAGLKTALLSNSWGVELYPRRRIDPIFDTVVISGEVGLRKPDPEIFEFTLEKLDVKAEEAIFVDDHPGHLKAAVDLGMKTILHRTPSETIDELEGLLGLELKTH